jgi:hypothetical protein
MMTSSPGYGICVPFVHPRHRARWHGLYEYDLKLRSQPTYTDQTIRGSAP